MFNVDFEGADRLIPRLDEAVRRPTPQDIAEGVKDSLVDLINDGVIHLPDEVQEPGAASYGRHLLYRSDEHDYVIVSMAWGPGQETPVHDHAGIWCVEGVWKGQLEVVQYDLREQNGDLFRFESQAAVDARPGSAGALIPPFEYHTLANRHPDETTITIHVYGRDLEDCCIFEERGEGWYLRRVKSLHYDN